MSDVYNYAEDGDFTECFESACNDAEYYQLDREAVNGDVIIIYHGDPINFCLSSFIPNILETISESMYDRAGEYAENWVVTDKQSKDVQKLVEKTIDAWATENNLHPNFYLVENVKAVKYKYLNNEWTQADDN